MPARYHDVAPHTPVHVARRPAVQRDPRSPARATVAANPASKLADPAGHPICGMNVN
jgi:hypothetical protein